MDLDDQERRAVRDLLGGDPALLDHLYDLDYDERPPPLDQFIDDPHYMGEALDEGVFSYWRNILHEIHRFPGSVIVFTGCVGSGKTSISCLYLAYLVCHLICMSKPQKLLGKLAASNLSIVFFSLSERLAQSETFGVFNSMLQMSPWFMERCTVTGTKHLVVVPPKRIKLALASPFMQGKGIVSKTVVAGILDEISDLSDEGELIEQKAFQVFTAVSTRMSGRFKTRGHQFGKLFLSSATENETAFIEAYLKKLSKSKNVKVYSPALWDVMPEGKYSEQTFRVAVANKFMEPKFVAPQDDVKELEHLGYKVINVPADFRDEFELDPDGAARRLAGISAGGKRSSKVIPSKESVHKAFPQDRPHPFSSETILIGNKTDEQVADFFSPDLIPFDRSIPRVAHIDIGLTGHALGGCMGHVSENVTIRRLERGVGKHISAPVITLDLLLYVKNIPRDEIAIWKVCDFLVQLRDEHDFNLVYVSFDGYQSRHGIQLLERYGFEAQTVSVHKNDAYYLAVCSTVLESRLKGYYHSVGVTELEEVEHDKLRRKVTPPIGGSDDLADAIAGVVGKLEEATELQGAEDKMTDLLEELDGKGTGSAADGPGEDLSADFFKEFFDESSS